MNRKTPFGALVSLVMAVLYGVSPIDIIPDVLPLIGLVDDAVVVPALLILAFMQMKRGKTRQPAVIRNRK